MSNTNTNSAVDFISTLAELKNGRAHIDCSRKLSELVSAVVDTKKKGKLILEMVIEPSGMEDGRVSETAVTWACRIAKPEHDTGRSLFFVTRDGRLTRNDPNQMDLYDETVEASKETQPNA